MPASAKRRQEIAKALTSLAPAMPFYDAELIREAATAPHMRALTADNAVWLAMIAYIRHTYTDYDQLRDEGYDKASAYFFILDTVNAKLTTWRATRLLDPDEPL